MDGKQRFDLVNTVTEWDRKQSTKKGYNRFALGHLFGAVQKVERLIDVHQWTLRNALLVSFNGNVLNKCLKAVNEKPYERFEELGLRVPDEDE